MKKICLAIIFLLVLCYLARAETIYLKSGKVVQGTIVAESGEFVRIDIGDGVVLRYYLDEIEKIERGPAVKSKIFRLKPSALLPLQKQEESSLGASEEIVTSEKERQIKPAYRPPETKAIRQAETPIVIPDNIKRIVGKYLDLAARPLSREGSLKDQRLRKFKDILDLDNMVSFSFFKKIMEEAKRQNPRGAKAQLEEGSLEDRFLESQILGFQHKYLKDANISDFHITDLVFSDDKKQATVWIEIENRKFKIKLHKVGQGWSIYSLN